MTAAIYYQIKPQDPDLHLFRVRLTVQNPDPDGQCFTLPAWIPGSYMIRDFAKNIVTLTARSGDVAIGIHKTDKQTWVCAPCDGPLMLDYQVYAWDLSVRSAHLDRTHAYFNGTSVFLEVVGQADQPCDCEILPPKGNGDKKWQVATAMSRKDAQHRGFGLYQAESYDELIDHPVDMGELTFLAFDACGVPHEMAIYGRHNADTERLSRDLKTICEHHIRFFGEPAPMDRYLFMVMAVGDAYGGLEHRASTSLMCKRDDLPQAGDEAVSEGYRQFLGLCSHEYFHTWNVKRIKPAVYLPYDLSQETYTPLLWAFEGITSYYDDLALYRTGLIDRDSYLELLGRTMTRVQRGAGRLKQTVTESSFDTWTKFYKQDENAPNAIVSYYTKGTLVALALDLTIRQKTHNQGSLDDVMRLLWQRFGAVGKGVGDEDIQAIAAEVAGESLDAFFHLALHSTQDLPLKALLELVGIDMNLRQSTGQDDQGGKPAEINKLLLTIGARTKAEGDGLKIATIAEGGPAHQAGLSAGDQIIALGGLKADAGRLAHLLKYQSEGDSIPVHAFRRDELMSFMLTFAKAAEDTVFLTTSTKAKTWP